MRKTLYLVLVIANCGSCVAQKPTKTLAELDDRIQKVYGRSDIPGFSVIVVNDHEVLYQRSLGYADLASKKEFTGGTIHNIASVSKTFIGVALMKAVEQGKLRLDDDINSYLPFKVIHPYHPNTPITVRQLSNHTSGIADGEVYQRSYVLENPSMDVSAFPKAVQKYVSIMKRNKKMDESDFLRHILSKEGKWYSKENFRKDRPGAKYHYSNLGATLAAYVIEKAVGVSYEEFTRKYIFEPLQMNGTGWNAADVAMEDHATRYFDKETSVPDYYLITRADGALMCHTTDFGNYLMEMIKGCHGKGRLLRPKSYGEMFTRKEFGKESSGIFWGVSKSGNPNHSGSDPGVITIASINPHKGLGLFFMSNFDAEGSRRTTKSALKILNSIKLHNWEK